MKKLVLAAVIALAAASAAQATTFLFSINHGGTNEISGTIDGLVEGNNSLASLIVRIGSSPVPGHPSLYFAGTDTLFSANGTITVTNGKITYATGYTSYYAATLYFGSNPYGNTSFPGLSWSGGHVTSPVANYFPAVAAPAAVPEPGTYLLMIGGFGLIGGMMRRKKAAISFA